MAGDTVRVTTESTEKDEQNLDRTITRSESTPRSEEESEKVNAAVKEWKGDHDNLKKKLSESKLESGKSVGSSSVAANTLSKGIRFNQRISKEMLRRQQFDAGGSDIYEWMYGNLWKLIFCIREMNWLIQHVKTIPMIKDKSVQVNEALKQLKPEDQDFVKKKLSELKHKFGESTESSRGQGDKNDDTDDTISNKLSQLKLQYYQCRDEIRDDRSIVKEKLSVSQPGVDGDRTIKRIEAVLMSEEEAKEVNAAVEQVKAAHANLKKKLSKSVRPSLEQDDQSDYISVLRANITGLDRCLENIKSTVTSVQAAPKSEEETEGVNPAAFMPPKTAELISNFLKSIGSPLVADNNAVISSKSAERDEGIKSKPSSSTDIRSFLLKRWADSTQSEIGGSNYKPKELKEGDSGTETVDEGME